ncbi:MAG TPA: sarcosine oxidase subunit delta [Aestuariivirgaceae bacterium]|jgi:sarcosine oxidase subunit delta
MRIRCPYCGERPSEEFTYLGDAAPERPLSNEPSSMDEWFDYVYLRDNPKGVMQEYWHHSGGCRSWIVAVRDTETHEISSTVAARDFAKGRGR